MPKRSREVGSLPTPPMLSRETGISTDVLIRAIHNGELEAINLGSEARPRYRVSREAFREFLESRRVGRTTSATNHTRKTSTVKEYV